MTKEKAKAFGEANRVEGGDGWQLMADFAASEVEAAVKAEREKIADELEDGHSCESNECWTCFYIDRLRSKRMM